LESPIWLRFASNIRAREKGFLVAVCMLGGSDDAASAAS
jgi:hypothetical protein